MSFTGNCLQILKFATEYNQVYRLQPIANHDPLTHLAKDEELMAKNSRLKSQAQRKATSQPVRLTEALRFTDKPEWFIQGSDGCVNAFPYESQFCEMRVYSSIRDYKVEVASTCRIRIFVVRRHPWRLITKFV